MTGRLVPIGATVLLGDKSGTVRDYMDKEGLPHVAVIEMHEPIPSDDKWQCVDMMAFTASEIAPL